MSKLNEGVVNSGLISFTSPLYEYWQSDQASKANKARLDKLNSDNTLSLGKQLFIQEPYKWEILYQCLIRDIIKYERLRDEQKLFDAVIKFLKLVNMLNYQEQTKLFSSLLKNNIINSITFDMINKIKRDNLSLFLDSSSAKKLNIINFLLVLSSIFLNPFRIEIKQEPSFIYEKTGKLTEDIRKLFS